ncbi:MAG: ligase-associated DNA damage response endonuclease PdeM [Bacteroidota bacterium]
MEIEIRHNNFTLHASGAIFWEEQNSLLISDVHLGKITHFRKHGFAIPENAIVENFKRLDEIVDLFKPYKIIFLGDLFHSKINNEWELFSEWVNTISAKIILVEGNHDIIGKQHYEELDIDIYPKLLIDEFLLTHHPTETEQVFNFCGHIHPGIKLKDLGRQSMKLPCFFRQKNRLILPAFGEFTGKCFMQPEQDDEVYAIAMDEVIKVI